MLDKPISPQWFFLPPFTAILTIGVTTFLRSSPPEAVDASFWGLVGLLFVILTILYGLFIIQDFTAGFLPVQMISQGILLCPLSLSMGARMLQWVGVTLATCGAVVLLAVYCKHRREMFLRAVEQLKISDESSLPLPFAVTDSQGSILSISDALLELKNIPRENALLGNIQLFFEPDSERVALGDKTWRIRRSLIKNNHFYFQLDELPAQLPLLPEETPAFIEPSTSLFTRAYAFRRVDEELCRIRRYQRFLTAVLLRVVFPDSSVLEDEEAFFISYCRLVKSNLRATDTVCLVGPRDVFLVMPETLQETGEGVVGKLLELLRALKERFSSVGSPSILQSAVFVNIESECASADALLELLDKELENVAGID